jgi:ferric-dicitrate binding protein FerR (iron transport regulator)
MRIPIRFHTTTIIVPFAFACLVGLTLLEGLAWAQNIAGSISQLTGSAQVQRAGATLGATQGMAIDLHDRISTAAASALTVTLTDGSTLAMGASSTLSIDENVVTGGTRQSTRVGLFGGSLRSLVSVALRGAAPNFQIQTPNAIAGVRGTDFEATYSDGPTRPGMGGITQFTDVAVHDGLVAVSSTAPENAGAPPELVPAGFETTVAGHLRPFPSGIIGLTGDSFTSAPPSIGAAPAPACPVCPACTVAAP